MDTSGNGKPKEPGKEHLDELDEGTTFLRDGGKTWDDLLSGKPKEEPGKEAQQEKGQPQQGRADVSELVDAMGGYFEKLDKAEELSLGREIEPPEGYRNHELVEARERVERAMDKVRERETGDMPERETSTAEAGKDTRTGDMSALGLKHTLDKAKEATQHAAAAERGD